MQSDNLTIAKVSYPIKYTMDNCEVYKGLLSLSYIEEVIYNDSEKAVYYITKANAIKLAIQTLLYNSNTQLYDNYLGGTTNPTQWYNNGVTATLWPQLFGIDEFDDSRSIYQREVLNTNFNGITNSNWTTASFLGTVDNFTWASVGLVFSSASDTEKGFEQANYIATVYTHPFPYPPCYVGDAGWAIMNMVLKYPSSNFCNSLDVIAIADENLLLYPNPASTYFKIQSTSDNQSLEVNIYDLLGNSFLKQLNSNIIEVSDLQSGIYFIRIIDKTTNYITSKKLIINR
ncbi:MAG TPA: T9SS type A sorting domain-containing protein [Flavobacterium sp.]|jgi:hypothetical protein|nr:T9SS type A sorting domain-containing protein [Flavobacterium sp.]